MIKSKYKAITRTIWLLSAVSLLTDMASEMLYPVMPVYLRYIGFSIFWIGILEGVAEAVAGLSKGYFGQLSDHTGRRLPFVQLGYTLSALSKPMIAFFISPWWVLIVRITDRIGKGVRTGARDAMLSDESSPALRGTVFGFHRAMDTFGAVLGPGLALIFLYYYPEQYFWLFMLAFLPGIAAVIITIFIKETPAINSVDRSGNTPGFLSFLQYWGRSAPRYRRLFIGLIIFALINSSDVFLLLAVREAGVTDSGVIGVYIFYNLVYAVMAYPAGRLADKIGLKRVLLAGMIIFAITYGSMGSGQGNWEYYIFIFLLYGVYAAATEGVSKAWLSQLCQTEDTATAIGMFTAGQSIAVLIASISAGWIWTYAGSGTMFAVSAAGAILAFLYILIFVKNA